MNMAKTMIGKMVDRFLGWKLPQDFGPDCGISFTPFHPNGTTRYEPIGTNLLTADQARQMFEHALGEDLVRLIEENNNLRRHRDELLAQRHDG